MDKHLHGRTRQRVVSKAHAKINLDLLVRGRRDDGYHLLDSLVMFAPVHDVVSVAISDVDRLTIDGPEAGLLKDASGDNLVQRAVLAFRQSSGISHTLDVQLTKNLPVASGIGGGSADAAATLRALQVLFDHPIDQHELQSIALQLGADVPVCLASVPTRMTGIGETLEPLHHLPNLPILLVNPRIAVSTRDIFRALNGEASPARVGPALRTENESPAFWLDHLKTTQNSLQAPAILQEPDIQRVIDVLGSTSGSELVRMSGSGATCFGIYSDTSGRDHAKFELQRTHPHWWIA